MKLINVFYLLICISFLSFCTAQTEKKIDRKTIVSRNDIIYTKPEIKAPVSVGNGKFAFTVDPTGLQTFPEAYNQLYCLGTMSDFGWHSAPPPREYKMEEVYKEFDSQGRKVSYVYSKEGNGRKENEAAQWFFQNPHRIGLAQIGLVMTKSDGSAPVISDLENINQRLELWTGCLTSYFELEGQPVKVKTIVHPEHDMIAFLIESPLVKTNRLSVQIKFPYAKTAWGYAPEDWNSPEKHSTEITFQNETRVNFSRKLDDEKNTYDEYQCSVTFPAGTNLEKEESHKYRVKPCSESNVFECSITFAPISVPDDLPSYENVKKATANYWEDYWSNGGFVDLSGSRDPRWRELERRIILSQYVMAVNNVSPMPPQECGLVQLSWYGKSHMEMVWLHEAHFALWGRLPMMMKSMDFYKKLLPSARERAQFQGYKGARWPKMIGPEGRESPGSINPFLVWQQPHPIYFAELGYRQNPTKETLDYWWEIVKETADFMATFVIKDPHTGLYDVGPPLNDVHEDSEIGGTKNTPFEVAYFRYGLELAREWRVRMGLESDPLWDDVAAHLAPIEIKDNMYDMPMVQMAMIPLPSGLDHLILEKTIEHRVKNLPKEACSWSYFVTAMSAARVNRPDLAVEALLFDSPCTSVSVSGYNYWCRAVPIYLPGNGALLSAVAMMAGGWDGAPKRNAPGFPDDGQWVIKSEGLRPVP